MITTVKQYLLLFLSLTLVMTPVSMVFANPFDGSNSVIAKKECHKKRSVENVTQMQTGKMSSDHSNIKRGKFTCKADCNHAQCTSGCADCAHCVIGLVSSIDQLSITHPSQINNISQTLYQKSFMTQYRPPKHS